MRRRRFDPFDRRAMSLSAAMHVALFTLGWLSTLYEPPQLEFITYKIELVSPPPARRAEEPEPAREELVVERPEPEPPPPEPEPEVEEIEPIEQPDPDPEPVQREEPPVEEPPEVADDPVVATSEDPPEVESDESGEDINVRIEGLQRDYPAYYANIISQVERCFRWREGGSWQTEIFFYIDREGNAEGIDFMTRSGNTRFDFRAMEAVECAGRGRFGALPDDLPYERFPVKFSFRPRGAPTPDFPAVARPGIR